MTSTAGLDTVGRSAVGSRAVVLEAAIAGTLVLLAAFLIPAGAIPIGAIRDEAAYLVLGRALSEGSYRSIHLVGEPMHVRYPPGYPLLLAPFWWLSGGRLDLVITAAAVLNSAVLGSAAALLWWIGRRVLSLSPALAALGLAPLLLWDARLLAMRPLTDGFLILGWALVVLLAARWQGRPADAARLGLLLGALTMIRTAAFGLLPAVALALPRRTLRLRSAAVLGLLAGAPALLWKLHAAARAREIGADVFGPRLHDASYTDYLLQALGQAPLVIARNLTYYGYLIGWNLGPWMPIGFLLLVILSLAFIAGSRDLLRSPLRFLPLGVLSMGLLVLLWPFVLLRLLVPVLPFAALVAACGIANRVPRAHAAVVATTILVAFAVRTAWFAAGGADFGRENPLYSSAHREEAAIMETAVEWARSGMAADEVIMVAKQQPMIFLRTGRRTADGAIAGPQELARTITSSGVDYVLRSGPPGFSSPLDALQRRCPDSFRPLVRAGGMDLLGITAPTCLELAGAEQGVPD